MDQAGPITVFGSVPLTAQSVTPTYKLAHYRRVGHLHSFKLDLLHDPPSPPNLLVVGDSRAERFQPSLLKQLTHRSAMNMSISNCEPEDAWAFTSHMPKRAPKVKLRLLRAIQMRGLTDTTFAHCLAYDTRLSRWFPPELVTEQKAAPPAAMSTRKNVPRSSANSRRHSRLGSSNSPAGGERGQRLPRRSARLRRALAVPAACVGRSPTETSRPGRRSEG